MRSRPRQKCAFPSIEIRVDRARRSTRERPRRVRHTVLVDEHQRAGVVAEPERAATAPQRVGGLVLGQVTEDDGGQAGLRHGRVLAQHRGEAALHGGGVGLAPERRAQVVQALRALAAERALPAGIAGAGRR